MPRCRPPSYPFGGAFDRKEMIRACVLLSRLAGMSPDSARGLPVHELRDWLDAAVEVHRLMEGA